jgi:predicted MPP superfamily phosphohydrolase
MKSFFSKYLQRSSLQTEISQIKIPVKSALLDGYRVLHISDLHIDTKTSNDELKELVASINAVSCDIVVITGDIIDCKAEKIEQKLLELRNIIHQSFYISGNHDLFHGLQRLQEIMQECNITFLDNAYTPLHYKDKKFILAGLSDKFSRFFHIERNESRLVKNLQNLQLPTIFIAHQPKDYIYAKESQSDLFLCGHTHGGQIYPFNYLVKIVQPFVSGLHIIDELSVFVSRGLGAWGIKYRFLIPREISLLQLEY